MNCMRCGAEMNNTTGGNYTCPKCDMGVNDLVYRPQNCDMPMPDGFFEKATEIFGRFGIAIKDSNDNVKDLYTLLCEVAEVWNKEK